MGSIGWVAWDIWPQSLTWTAAGGPESIRGFRCEIFMWLGILRSRGIFKYHSQVGAKRQRAKSIRNVDCSIPWLQIESGYLGIVWHVVVCWWLWIRSIYEWGNQKHMQTSGLLSNNCFIRLKEWLNVNNSTESDRRTGHRMITIKWY